MKKTCLGFMLLLLIGCSPSKTVTPAEQLQIDITAIDKYLADNMIVAQTDPSGLRYVISTLGTGSKPLLTSVLTVKYTGKLLSSGAIFDTSTTATNPTGITNLNGTPLSGFIQGWQVAFQLIPKGSKATLYIPSGLGYGKKGSTTGGTTAIPPNANLIFDVELISFK